MVESIGLPITTQFYFNYSQSHRSLAEIYAAFGGYISVYEYMLDRVSESVGIEESFKFELKTLDVGSKLAVVDYFIGFLLPDGTRMFDAFFNQKEIKTKEDAESVSKKLNDILQEQLCSVDATGLGCADPYKCSAIRAGLHNTFDGYDAAYLGELLSAANEHTFMDDSMHICPGGDRPSGTGNVDINYKQKATAQKIMAGYIGEQNGFEVLLVITAQHEGNAQWVFKSSATGRLIKARIDDTYWLENYQSRETRKIKSVYAHVHYQVWREANGKIKPISGGVIKKVDPNKTKYSEGDLGEQNTIYN